MKKELDDSVITLTKNNLVTSIAKDTGFKQLDVFAVVQKTLDGIIDALEAGKHVEFREFGVFQIATRKARVGRNPNKPDNVVIIPVRNVVKFKPGKRMRQMLANRPTTL